MPTLIETAFVLTRPQTCARAQDGLWWKDEIWEFPGDDWADPASMWFGDVQLVQADEHFKSLMSFKATGADDNLGDRYAWSPYPRLLKKLNHSHCSRGIWRLARSSPAYSTASLLVELCG
jgi:hypothetical protein